MAQISCAKFDIQYFFGILQFLDDRLTYWNFVMKKISKYISKIKQSWQELPVSAIFYEWHYVV